MADCTQPALEFRVLRNFYRHAQGLTIAANEFENEEEEEHDDHDDNNNSNSNNNNNNNNKRKKRTASLAVS